MKIKITENLSRIKDYFKLIFSHSNPPKAKLLSSNEALKKFANLWAYHGNDVMMMIALIEHEYISENSYTEAEIAAIKNVLSKVATFMKNCEKEWQEYEKSQQRKVEQKRNRN